MLYGDGIALSKYRFQEGPTGTSDHEMCLWDRKQIAEALPAFKAALDALSAGSAC